MSVPRRFLRSDHPDVLYLFETFTQEQQEVRDAFFAAWPDIEGIEGKDDSFCWVVVLKDENASPAYLRKGGIGWSNGKKVTTMRPNKRPPEGKRLDNEIDHFAIAMRTTPYHRLAKHFGFPVEAWLYDQNKIGRIGANKTDRGIWLSLPFRTAGDAAALDTETGVWVDVPQWEFQSTFEKPEVRS